MNDFFRAIVVGIMCACGFALCGPLALVIIALALIVTSK